MLAQVHARLLLLPRSLLVHVSSRAQACVWQWKAPTYLLSTPLAGQNQIILDGERAGGTPARLAGGAVWGLVRGGQGPLTLLKRS